jgi:hypothetical protein
MSIASNSRCKKCSKVLGVPELKDNPSGVGVICIDPDLCEKQQSKNKSTESK